MAMTYDELVVVAKKFQERQARCQRFIAALKSDQELGLEWHTDEKLSFAGKSLTLKIIYFCPSGRGSVIVLHDDEKGTDVAGVILQFCYAYLAGGSEAEVSYTDPEHLKLIMAHLFGSLMDADVLSHM